MLHTFYYMYNCYIYLLQLISSDPSLQLLNLLQTKRDRMHVPSPHRWSLSYGQGLEATYVHAYIHNIHNLITKAQF